MAGLESANKARKRKSHTKSRAGCASCRLRRVKCDEAKPGCRKCQAYGVACDYSGHAIPSELQLAVGEEVFELRPSTPPPERIRSMLGMALTLHETEIVYRMTEDDLQLMRRFEERTVYTVGSAATVPMYKDYIVAMCNDHAFLAHMVLTLVLMHDRAVAHDPGSVLLVKESFHWYHATGLIREMLSLPVPHGCKDALWVSVALLGCATMAFVDARSPAEAWPLAPSSDVNLEWLDIVNGKMEVWKLTDPLREDSIWRAALMVDLEGRDKLEERAPQGQLATLLPYLCELSGFDESARTEDDPYQTATSILLRLLGLECNYSTIIFFLSWLGHMDPRFRVLLGQKDGKALLLLSWWYAVVWEYQVWWMRRRVELECPSICLYLEQHYSHDLLIMRLLDYPLMVCGLSRGARSTDQAQGAKVLAG